MYYYKRNNHKKSSPPAVSMSFVPLPKDGPYLAEENIVHYAPNACIQLAIGNDLVRFSLRGSKPNRVKKFKPEPNPTEPRNR